MTCEAWRVGVDAIERIVVMDNHDAAYGVWRDAGVNGRTLIHVDAHHDMWWQPSPDKINIADFISAALAGGLVRDVFWVVPDRDWGSARTRRPILRHLREMTKRYPEADRRIRIEPRRLWTRLGSTRLTVCPFRFLPHPKEVVLLDIDVDFMIIPRPRRAYGDR